MKINNDPKKYNENENESDQPGIIIADRFIPYTWFIGIGGAIVMVGLFIGVMVMTSGDDDVTADPETEEVEEAEDADETDTEEASDSEDADDATDTEATDAENDAADAENVEELEGEELEEYEKEVARMWDAYIDEKSNADSASSEDEPADDAASEDEPDTTDDTTDDTTEDTPEDTSVDAVSEEEMVETIKAFLTGYQIYGPGDTAQEQYDRIYPHVTEAVANELVPNRGGHEAGPSIDVTHELVDIRVDTREGVENDYVATMVYTREAMDEVIQYTDVYSIRTDGERVSSVDIRSSTWE